MVRTEVGYSEVCGASNSREQQESVTRIKHIISPKPQASPSNDGRRRDHKDVPLAV